MTPTLRSAETQSELLLANACPAEIRGTGGARFFCSYTMRHLTLVEVKKAVRCSEHYGLTGEDPWLFVMRRWPVNRRCEPELWAAGLAASSPKNLHCTSNLAATLSKLLCPALPVTTASRRAHLRATKSPRLLVHRNSCPI